MKAYKLLKALGQIDEDLICTEMPKQKRNRKAWLAAAACLCLIITAALVFIPSYGNTPTPDIPAVDSPAVLYNCFLGNKAYTEIGFAERKQYGLVPEDAIGLDEGNTYQITEADLGEPMGTVTKCYDASYIGCPVYHFSKFPDDSNICIILTPQGYRFYTFSHIELPQDAAKTSDSLLEAYGLPDGMVSMTVEDICTATFQTVDDPESRNEILQILSGKEDKTYAERERRFVQCWQQTYGNDKVRIDEETGQYQVQKDGTEWDYELLEQVEQFWRLDVQVIYVYDEDGYEYQMVYYPHLSVVNIVTWASGEYVLTQEETVRLNTLLGIAPQLPN